MSTGSGSRPPVHSAERQIPMTDSATGIAPRRTLWWYLRFAAACFLCGLILAGGVLVVAMLISVRLAALLMNQMNHSNLSELALAPFLLGAVCAPRFGVLIFCSMTAAEESNYRWSGTVAPCTARAYSLWPVIPFPCWTKPSTSR